MRSAGSRRSDVCFRTIVHNPSFGPGGLSANDSLAQLTMSSDGVLVLFPSGTRPGICTNAEAGHAEESVGSINYTASTTSPKQFELQSANTGAGRVTCSENQMAMHQIRIVSRHRHRR